MYPLTSGMISMFLAAHPQGRDIKINDMIDVISVFEVVFWSKVASIRLLTHWGRNASYLKPCEISFVYSIYLIHPIVLVFALVCACVCLYCWFYLNYRSVFCTNKAGIGFRLSNDRVKINDRSGWWMNITEALQTSQCTLLVFCLIEFN